jgi:hypothetical protein
MTCMDDYEIKSPMYGAWIERNKCIRANNGLENELMHLY